MESLESQRRRAEKAKLMWREEQATDAWYVTLLGSLLGWHNPLTKIARERARHRNAQRASSAVQEY